jgi:RND family efflux transporter MFP subunit
MKATTIIISTIITLTFATSCGEKVENNMPLETPVKVSLATAETAFNGKRVHASGRLEAAQSANLSTRMMGQVDQLSVKMGEYVKQGSLLLSINSSDLQAKKAQVEASIHSAEVAFANAEKDLQRFQQLQQQGSASSKELENITLHYEMSKAGLERAKEMKKEVDAQFAYLNIRAPFSGVISQTFVKEGDMANPGMPLLSMDAATAGEASVMVAETDIEKIAPDMPVKLLLKSLQKEVQGKVSEVSHSSKNTGGQYLVKVRLNQTDSTLLPGMFVNASIVVDKESEEASVYLPLEAIVQNGQLNGVYTPNNEKNRAILRWLRLGKRLDDKVEVLSGIKPGENYILKAEGKLFNGAVIQ